MDPNVRNDPAAIDVGAEILTTVTFTTDLLELVMVMAGSTDIKAGSFGKRYIIRIGGQRFESEDQTETFRKVLYWLLTAKPIMSREEYAVHAASVLDMEKADAEALLDALAQGGMTDFGKKVQEYRADRGAKIFGALRDVKAVDGQIPRDISVLIDLLKAATGYEDIEAGEVVLAIGDMQKLENTFH